MDLTYVGGAAAVVFDGVRAEHNGKPIKVTDEATCKRLLASSNWRRTKEPPTEKSVDPKSTPKPTEKPVDTPKESE